VALASERAFGERLGNAFHNDFRLAGEATVGQTWSPHSMAMSRLITIALEMGQRPHLESRGATQQVGHISQCSQLFLSGRKFPSLKLSLRSPGQDAPVLLRVHVGRGVAKERRQGQLDCRVLEICGGPNRTAVRIAGVVLDDHDRLVRHKHLL
jgi:hypothetical protein